MKENYGDLKGLEELGKYKKNSYTTEQLIDAKLKVSKGENRIEVAKRMEKIFSEILKENRGKKLAIVSHGASIKFLLIKWCSLDENYELEFNKKLLKIESPSIMKLIFEDEKLKDLIQIY